MLFRLIYWFARRGFLGIQKKEDKKWQPFYIDFTKGQLHYRSKQAGLRSELIARAMGAKPKDQPKILDATAGLGKDAFILASLGFHLTMLETSPIVYYLLADGLKRARNSLETAEIADRLHLIHADAIDWLQNPPFSPDIIYLDPMFPERKKSASVKKDMVFLQELLGKCENQENLFSKAFACAKKRVVVKRPRKAACLSTERKPDFAFEGKSSRFDIYLNNRR